MTGETDERSQLGRRGFLRAGAGAVAATVAAGAAGQAAAQSGQTHTVDMTDELIYDPEEITIAPGDTVVWDNVGAVGHSVTAYEDGIPGDAEYFASGGFDNEQAARDGYPGQGNILGGETYEYTFEVPGDYEYFCIPHEAVDMVGVVHVEEGAGGGADDGGGAPSGQARVPPGTALLGGSLMVALLAPLLFGLFVLFRRRRGTGATAAATAPIEEAPEVEPKVTLGHDDFNPIGTATLVAIYFVIVVLLWIFMYFFEFLGRGPTVIG